MICGITNGGLGLKMADNTSGGKIAYIVLAALMGAAYIVTVIFRRKHNDKNAGYVNSVEQSGFKMMRRRADREASTTNERADVGSRSSEKAIRERANYA